jgi:hypothetical protein
MIQLNLTLFQKKKDQIMNNNKNYNNKIIQMQINQKKIHQCFSIYLL